jgi:hypothetical protein
MARRRAAKRKFLMIPETVYRSPAWRTLPHAALRLWIDLRTLYSGHNNGKIAPTFAVMQTLGWNSKDSLQTSLRTLLERGFLAYTRKAGPNVFHRASLVRFTDLACPHDEGAGISGCQPSNEFLVWQRPAPNRRRFSAVPRWAGRKRPGRRGTTAP